MCAEVDKLIAVQISEGTLIELSKESRLWQTEQVSRESKGAANVNWTGFSRAEEVKGCR